jgi:Vacuolar import and degradation protein
MQRNIEAARHAPTASSYADRSTSRQSLYDWAASDSDDSEDHVRRQSEAPLILELRRDREMNEDNQDGWRDLEEALSSHRRRRNQIRRDPGNNDPASRGATLPFWNDDLQSVQAQRRDRQSYASPAAAANAQAVERGERRRQERIMSLLEGSQSQRLRNRVSREGILIAMEGFMVDRDRRNQQRGDSTASASRSAYGATLHRTDRVSEIMKESQRYRSSRVRNMVEYLSRVRECDLANLDDTVALAMELDVAKNVDGDDIVAETRSIQPPPWTSLLTPGSTFTGSQHAPHDASGAHLLSRDRDYLRRMVANRNLSSAHLPGSIASLVSAERYLLDHPSRSHYTSTLTSRASARMLDHWPVSVSLHTVDMDNLTITGTMSANHIPDKFSPNSPDHRPEGSSMKSYFEGEIIDMNTFTLETETYKKEGVNVDIETDVEYWRQLGPFREEVEKVTSREGKGVDSLVAADVRLASCLGSIEWVKRVIGREWILMRFV